MPSHTEYLDTQGALCSSGAHTYEVSITEAPWAVTSHFVIAWDPARTVVGRWFTLEDYVDWRMLLSAVRPLTGAH